MDLKDAEIERDMFKFQTLFECFNQPDSKLTKSGINTRNAVHELVLVLYNEINNDKPNMDDWNNPKTRTKLLEKKEELIPAKTAAELLEKLGTLNSDFSSVETGDIEDIKEYNNIMKPIRELKKEDKDKLRKMLDTDKPLKTIQRLLILYEVRLDAIYYISKELKELFR